MNITALWDGSADIWRAHRSLEDCRAGREQIGQFWKCHAPRDLWRGGVDPDPAGRLLAGRGLAVAAGAGGAAAYPNSVKPNSVKPNSAKRVRPAEPPPRQASSNPPT